MKQLAFLVLTLVATATANAAQKWKYTAFPIVKSGSSDNLPSHLDLGGKVSLKAVLPKNSGTHRILAVEQLYTEPTSLKRVFVKKNVKVNSDLVVGGWVPVARGYVLHLRTGKTLTAFYTENLTNRERLKMETQLRAKRSVVEIVWFLPSAHAEVTGGEEPAPNASVEGATPGAENANAEACDGFLSCFAKQTKDMAWEAGSKAWEATKSGVSYAVDDPLGAASAAGSYVWNNAYDAGAAVVNGGISVAKGAYNAVTDPAKTWENIRNSADQMYKLGQEMWANLKKSLPTFASLSTMVQTQVMCGIAADALKEGLPIFLTAVTGVGGAIAGAKVAKLVLKYVSKIKPAMATLMALSKLKDATAETVGNVATYVRKMLSGEVSPEDAEKLLGKAAVADTKVAETANPAAAAESTATTTTATAGNPAQLAAEKARLKGMSMEERTADASKAKTKDDRTALANKFLGRPITGKQADALEAAHGIGGKKTYGEYTQGELLAKRKALVNAGFSADEADVLILRGVAGNARDGYVTGTVHFGRSTSSSSLTPAAADARATRRYIYQAGFEEKAEDVKAAKESLVAAAKKQIYEGDIDGARQNYLTAGEPERFVNTYMVDDNRGPLKLTVQGRLEMERQIRGMEGDIFRIQNTTNPGNEAVTYSQEYIHEYVKTRKTAIKMMKERIQNLRDGVYDDD